MPLGRAMTAPFSQTYASAQVEIAAHVEEVLEDASGDDDDGDAPALSLGNRGPDVGDEPA